MSPVATPDALHPGVLLCSVARVVPVAAVRALPADLPVAAERLFTWPMEISSDRLDSYYTRMDPDTTLPNYARDAEAGVAFLAGHNTRALPFGYTYAGAVQGADAGVVRVRAEAYTVRGLALGDVRTDDFIAGVEAQLVRDVSVGFLPGRVDCSICQRDWLTDWSCPHWPGLTYEVKGDDGVLRQQLCWGLVVDGRLVEVSAVYAGATPGAAILKAEREIALGRADDVQIRRLEQQYRIRLPEKPIRSAGVTLPDALTLPDLRAAGALPAPDPTPDEETRTVPTENEQTPETSDAALGTAEIAKRSTTIATVDVALSPELRAELEKLQAQIAELTAQAADGQRYRADLIDRAIAEGIRALGATFDENAYRALLAEAPIAIIQRMHDDWSGLAAVRFPGGRQSTDTSEQEPTATPPAVPARAYRS